METLKIDLEYCYGINKLVKDFDFTSGSTYVIYAPNGAMKTSFANAFRDLSNDVESKDIIYPERTTLRNIKDEDDNDILAENVFVIEPYNKDYDSDRKSVLLVNASLKEEYENIIKNREKKKVTLVSVIKSMSGLRSEVEKTIIEVITKTDMDFCKAIIRLKSEVLDSDEPLFSNIIYKKIFTEKSEELLSEESVRKQIEEYIKKYNDLIQKSRFFTKGIFNHTNASIIAKNLNDNGFFEANHSINLHSTESDTEINTEEELKKVIEEEKRNILEDPELISIFDTLESKLNKNKELRNFRDYLIENMEILPELINLDAFKEKLWISYLKEHRKLYEELVNEYEIGVKDIERITRQANEEATQWSYVIEEFNNRFSVPFVLSVGNQGKVILNSEAPVLEFIFKGRSGNDKKVDKTELMTVLSTGERRALYLLNIIFEIQARKEANIDTLLIIDDIADSFDYKNKYAIVEYLKDISKINGFKQIILTHNYDFFRTVSARLKIKGKHTQNADKSDTEISIYKSKYQNNPFEHWKTKLSVDNNMLIASIPFVRNITEYIGDKTTFNKLTSLLHYKEGTNLITINDLELAFKSVLKDISGLTLNDSTDKVVDLIFGVCEQLMSDTGERIDLEKKICLSIGIRLKAEMYMVKEINDEAFWKSISKYQTAKLTERFLTLGNLSSESIRIIELVNLMTPENIHLNSFMYEPILDMSIHHLRDLYTKVKAL